MLHENHNGNNNDQHNQETTQLAISLNRMPCKICKDLDITQWESLYIASVIGTATRTEDLRASSKTGECQFCKMLYRGIRRAYPEDKPEAFYFWRQEDTGIEEPLLWFKPQDESDHCSEFHSLPPTESG